MRGSRLARGLILLSGIIFGLVAFTSWAAAREIPARGASIPPSSVGLAASPGTSPGGPSTRGGAIPPRLQAGLGANPSTLGAKSPEALTIRPTPRDVRAAAARSRSLGGVFQGQNTSTGGSATSGPATASTTVVVNAGPSGGSQVGDNIVDVDVNATSTSGPAVNGSQVFGDAGNMIVSPSTHIPSLLPLGTSGFGLTSRGLRSRSLFSPLFTPTLMVSGDNLFATDSFGDALFVAGDNIFATGGWGWSGSWLGTQSLFGSQIRLHQMELLIDQAEDCLARLADNPSVARLRVCEHLVDLAEAHSFAGLTGPAVFWSQGGTSVLSSSWGTFVASPSGNTFAGTVAWNGFGFPVGTHGHAGNAALFAPWSWSPLFFSGVGFWSPWQGFAWTTGDLIRLHVRLAILRARLEHLALHRALILRTIGFRSLAGDPWFGWFAPFGHRTVFVAGDNVFVASAPWWSNFSWSRWWRPLGFSTNFFFRPIWWRSRPILDLPGITISGWGWA